MELPPPYLDLPLELMKTMVLLHHYKNLKKVGEILNKSESVVSRDISKLRNKLKDPIFIRSGQGMELTPLIHELAPKIEQHYNQMASLLKHATLNRLDFSTYSEPIVIAVNSRFCQSATAKIAFAFHQYFPQAKLHIHPWSRDTLSEINQGIVDIGLHFMDLETNKDIAQQYISSHNIILASHPDVKIEKLDDVLEYLLVITKLASWNEHRYHLLEKLKLKPTNVMYVDSTSSALDIIKSMPAVAFLPDYMCKNQNVNILDLNNLSSYSLSSYFKQTNRANPLTLHLHKLLFSVMSDYN